MKELAIRLSAMLYEAEQRYASLLTKFWHQVEQNAALSREMDMLREELDDARVRCVERMTPREISQCIPTVDTPYEQLYRPPGID